MNSENINYVKTLVDSDLNKCESIDDAFKVFNAHYNIIMSLFQEKIKSLSESNTNN